MKIKLIAVDMDGTFLNSKNTYNKERFNHLFKKMKEKGIHFVVASGNPILQIKPFFKDYGNEITYIGENGGHIEVKGEEIFLVKIHDRLAHKIMVKLLDYPDVLNFICTKEKAYILDTISKEDQNTFAPYFPHMTLIKDYSYVVGDIIKFALYAPHQDIDTFIEELNTILGDGIKAVDSGHHCVDIIVEGVHKASALEKLKNLWHISPENMMAFGDSKNDIEMLRYVKYGYVMDNAKEEMKKMFSYHAKSNDDEGVLDIIEKMMLNN